MRVVPAGSVNSLVIGWRDAETYGWHHGLISCGTDDLPLSSLRVILQYTLLSFTDGDLRERHRDGWRGRKEGKWQVRERSFEKFSKCALRVNRLKSKAF